MAYVLVCGFEVNEFDLLLRYDVHLGINSVILKANK